jgi:hypothetical protein
MGKVSDKDFAEMSGRLRARAARLIRQLDAGAGYRNEIEREIVKRIGAAPGGSNRLRPEGASASLAEAREEQTRAEAEEQVPVAVSEKQDPVYAAGVASSDRSTDDVGPVLVSRPAIMCAACSTANDVDARFCKHCGAAMEGRS